MSNGNEGKNGGDGAELSATAGSPVRWYPFAKAKGSRQKRPPLRKWVVVQLRPAPPEKLDLGVELKPGVPGLVASYPPGIAVGYRKDAAGDKQCPYFVVPGIGGDVMAWCDCLPENFEPPRFNQENSVIETKTKQGDHR